MMTYTIIGAGIGGLTLGLAFQKKGIDYCIYEKFSDLKNVGAGIWLSPNALQVFEYLDVLDEIKNSGNSIDRITIGKPDLSAISDNRQEEIKLKFGYSAIAVSRATLQKILLDKIQMGNIKLSKEFECYDSSGHEKVKANFSGGSTTESKYLIGADGINSKVRKQLFPDSILRYSGQTCWRGIALTEISSEFDNRVYELWGNQVRFGISRISKGKYYWFAVALDVPNRKDDSLLVKQKLLQMFGEFHSTVNALIEATPTDKIMRNDINDLKPMRKWYNNRVCLIGDAGHATTPNMGQGGAQAIEDAYHLSHLQSMSPTENVFELLQRKRQKKVNSIVKQSWTTGKLAHWKYGQGFRNFMLKSVPKRLLIKKMIDMYSIDKYSD